MSKRKRRQEARRGPGGPGRGASSFEPPSPAGAPTQRAPAHRPDAGGHPGGRELSKRGEAQARLEQLLASLPASPPEEEISAFRALGVAAEGVLLERIGRAAGRDKERPNLLALARLLGGERGPHGPGRGASSSGPSSHAGAPAERVLSRRPGGRLREGIRRMAEGGEFSLGELRALGEGEGEGGEGVRFALPVGEEELEGAERLAREFEGSSPPERAVERFLALPRLLQGALIRELCPVSPPSGDVGPKLLSLASALSEKRAMPPSALVEVLSRWEVQEAAEALAAFLGAASAVEEERALRKALYQLQRRGVAPPPRREEEEPRPSRPAVEFARAFASTVDGMGQQILWIARSRPGGGRYLFQALIRQGAGIEEFYARQMPTREARELLGRLRPEGPYPIVEVPPAYACWLLARAREENGNSGTPLPSSYTSEQALLEPLEDAEAYPPAPHPIRRLLPEAGTLDLGEDWARFLARAEFGSWLLPRERLEEYARRFAEVAESRLVLTEEQRGARMREVVRGASQELFEDGELRSRYRERLEGMAYLYHQMGAAAEARAALRAASGLAPEARTPPPFFELLTHRSLLACLQPEGKATEEETPAGEAQPPSAVLRPGVAEGRIILP